jgi:hypothetical protein
MKRVTGIGGIFFKAKDPKALGAWYKKHLGIDVQGWGRDEVEPAHDILGSRRPRCAERFRRRRRCRAHAERPDAGDHVSVAGHGVPADGVGAPRQVRDERGKPRAVPVHDSNANGAARREELHRLRERLHVLVEAQDDLLRGRLQAHAEARGCVLERRVRESLRRQDQCGERADQQ